MNAHENQRIVGGLPMQQIAESTTNVATSPVQDHPVRSPALHLTGVTKRFGGVTALDDVSLEVTSGRVHALLGENGAGKSTLVKIVAGALAPDDGEVLVQGLALEDFTPQASRAAGIGVVYQELSLFPNLSVAHNLFLTNFPRTRPGLLSTAQANEAARTALAKVGLDDLDPRRSVGDLSLDRQQMLEIAKAVVREPRILVLDEATSSLSAKEVDRLLGLIDALKAAGTTVIVISHRMDEIWRISDEVTILRDGKSVAGGPIGDFSPNDAVRLMAGRDVQTSFPEKAATSSSNHALTFEGVRLLPKSPAWNLELRRGEVLGLGGLEGQGQREFLRWLYGLHRAHGKVRRNGRLLRIRRPKHALKAGIAFIPEDRKVEGLHLDLSVQWNVAMATLPQRSVLGFIRFGRERQLATEVVDSLSVKVDSLTAPVSSLSGGTQQKVVLGKFMASDPEILLFMDPTRGIDVRTKFEFYELLKGLTTQGKSCIVYSSDTAELAGIADRVAVFHDGAVAALLEGDDVTQEKIVAAAFVVTGGSQ